MRLTQEQIRTILSVTSRFVNERADVYLFGSRLDEKARGGDLDLLIETDDHLPLINQARIKLDLESSLNLPVDIVARDLRRSPTPFQILARAKAERLVAE